MDLRPEIRISMFGAFSVSCSVNGEERRLNEQSITSRRLWLFLQYMAACHHREVTQEELLNVLWWDEESANPANAMKTLLHRARTVLEELGFSHDRPAILYRRGIYRWSDEVDIRLDTELFESLCAGAEQGSEEYALQAAQLYQGEFLATMPECPWIVSVRMYYHAKYMDLCARTAVTLNEKGRHSDAIRICRAAVDIDPYEEACHLQMMSAMAAIGLVQPALQHYHYVTGLFADQLGVRPSQEMTDMYRRLNRSNLRMETDLGEIRRRLVEPKTEGAFYCEYSVFREIYHLEARRVARSGQEIQLLLINLLDSDGACMSAARCPAAMEEMKGVLLAGLRGGDIFARFSPAQYLVLLSGANGENGELVFRRLHSRYAATLMGKTTSVTHAILPVEPMAGD